MCIAFVLHGFHYKGVSIYFLSCIFKSCFLLNFRPDDHYRYIVKKVEIIGWLFVLFDIAYEMYLNYKF